MDASGGYNSFVSANYNEFYLCSHTAIQGTAKPARYTLIYDTIGLKVSSIPLQTQQCILNALAIDG